MKHFSSCCFSLLCGLLFLAPTALIRAGSIPPGANPPEVVNPIPDQLLLLADAPFTVDLNTVFNDSGGGELFFFVAPNGQPTVNAVVNGSQLSVSPLAIGMVELVVTALNTVDEAVQDTFKVTVRDGLIFETELSSANVVPPTLSNGTGSVTATLNATRDQLTIEGSFSNLGSTYLVSHLHQAAVGVNGAVTIPLFPTLDADNLGGTYDTTVPIDADQLQSLETGNLYLLIHTNQYPGGAIRGQFFLRPNTAPDAAPINSPVDNALFDVTAPAPTDPFVVTWDAVTDPDGQDVFYVWQLATDETFNTTLISNKTGTTTFGALDLFLENNGVEPGEAVTWFYRVVSSDGGRTAATTQSVRLSRGPQLLDLAVEKVVDNEEPEVGQTVTYTVTLTNNGPSTATGVSVTDVLPAGLAFVSATGSYNEATGVWIVGTVANAAKATLAIRATVEQAGPITNTATITAVDQQDTDNTNDSSTADLATRILEADLALANAVDNETPEVGQTVTFTVTLTNNGPDEATAITVNDLLLEGLSLVSSNTSEGTYDAGNGNWTLATLTASASATLTLQASVDVPGPLTNTATIMDADPDDPDAENNTATATVTAQAADLEIDKMVDKASAGFGETVIFTVTLTNNGPNDATAITVMDALPTGLVFSSANTDTGAYDEGTGAWTVDALAVSATATLTLAATVDADDAVTNTATITAASPADLVAGNNTAEATVTRLNQPPTVDNPINDLFFLVNDAPFEVDLKTVFSDPNGDELAFSLNTDGQPTVNATLDGSQLSITPLAIGMVELVVTALDAFDEQAHDTVLVRVQDGLAFEANLSSVNTVGPTLSNGTGKVTATLNADQNQVFLTGTFSNLESDYQASHIHTGIVGDNGPIIIPLFPSLDGDNRGGTFNNTFDINATQLQALKNGGLFLLVHSAAYPGGVIRGQLFPSPNQAPGRPVITSPDDGAVFDVEAAPSAPFAVTWNAVTDSDGQDVFYVWQIAADAGFNTLLASNKVASGTSVSTTLGDIATLMEANGIGLGGAVTWHYRVFSSDGSEVAASTSRSARFIRGAPGADLEIDKEVDNETPEVGEQVRFTVTLTNNGPTTATAITVVDMLPEGLSLVVFDADAGTYIPSLGTWVIGSLAVDASAVLTINATVDQPGAITNTATITTALPADPVAGNDTSDATVTGQAADLEIDKEANNETPDVGQTVQFTLTLTNNGPSDATDITVTDVLPEGLTFVTSNADAGAYDTGTGAWTLATLTATATATLTIDAMVDKVGSITNAATITGSSPIDLNADNNTSDVTLEATERVPLADLEIDKEANNETPDVGQTVGFTVTLTNNGPDDASAITVTDALPTGLTLTAFNASTGTYNSGAGTWTVDALAASATATLTMDVTVGQAGAIKNEATITAAMPDDPDTSNNTSDVTLLATSVVVPPVVTPVPPTSTPVAQGANYTVRTAVANATENTAVTLHYRRGGEATFNEVTMAPSGNTFEAQVPGGAVTDRGLEYFITALTTGTQEVTSALFGVRTRIEGLTTQLSSGTLEGSYRMLSMPLDLDNQGARAVLEDDLGAYDDKQWRFFEILSDQSGREGPASATMSPGKAFWILSRTGGTITTGAGTSSPTHEPLAINLHAEWNLIGNSFNFSLTQSRLRLESGGVLQLNQYNGSWSTFTGQLQPFAGYAVRVAEQDRLLIEPVPAAKTEAAGKGTTEEPPMPSWGVRIIAEAGAARDDNNIAGVSPQASAGRDDLDWYEPPVIGDYVSVYFPQASGTVRDAFTIDVRPEPVDGEAWDFEVRSNVEGPIDLHFDGVADVPPGFEVWLVDEALQVTQDLRARSGYAVLGQGAAHPKRLRLVVGRSGSAEVDAAAAQAVPDAFELLPGYPNPFNTTTTIRYRLPEPRPVTLTVYNVLGEEVATLVQGATQEAGAHAVFWDGRDRQGRPLASGVYLCRLQAGGFTATHTLLLVR